MHYSPTFPTKKKKKNRQSQTRFPRQGTGEKGKRPQIRLCVAAQGADTEELAMRQIKPLRAAEGAAKSAARRRR